MINEKDSSSNKGSMNYFSQDERILISALYSMSEGCRERMEEIDKTMNIQFKEE